MASGASFEILDLRHFAAPMLRPVLEAESELWKQRLHWDYNVSARLLMQYLDSHTLPGYAALEAGQVTGFVFCIYEETKAVIGDVFVLPVLRADGGSAHEVEETLLRHLLELLMNSPQVDRIESQLLLHPTGSHAGIFLDAGFEWREPGCSMCVGMNGDLVAPGQRCASTSNRNFVGRQGRGARTHLVSPAMAAAAAVTGRFTDVRRLMAGAA